MSAPIGIFKHARETISLGAGEAVFAEGDPGDVMYAVIEGTVEISRDGAVIEKVGEGGIFGELALVDSSPRGAAATAAGPVKLAIVDKQQFTFLVHEHPTFALQVMAVMAQRMRHANEH